MASTKQAFRSIMDTAVKTAGTINATLDAAVTSVGMANAFVTKAATEQAKSYAIQSAIFDLNLARESAQEQAQSDLAADDFRKLSTEHARLFDTHLSNFENILSNFKSNAPAQGNP